MLETPNLLHLRATSKKFHLLMSDDDVWMDKLTSLMLQHQVLADMDKGPEETYMQWHVRCYQAVADGSAMATKHKEGAMPFLKMQ